MSNSPKPETKVAAWIVTESMELYKRLISANLLREAARVMQLIVRVYYR